MVFGVYKGFCIPPPPFLWVPQRQVEIIWTSKRWDSERYSKPYQLYVNQRPYAVVKSPYKWNVEQTQALFINLFWDWDSHKTDQLVSSTMYHWFKYRITECIRWHYHQVFYMKPLFLFCTFPLKVCFVEICYFSWNIGWNANVFFPIYVGEHI